MKKTVLYLISALLSIPVSAQTPIELEGVGVTDASIERSGNYMQVDIDLLLKNLDVKSNRALILTPVLTGINDTTASCKLPSVGIYGRNRYLYYLRQGKSSIAGDKATNYREEKCPDSISYRQLLDYEPWMRKSSLTFTVREFGCCSKLISEKSASLADYAAPVDLELIFVRPQAEQAKNRSLEGSAYIDFPVDKTVIYPDYRRNTAELGRIRATIDSVRSDKDVTITSVWLKGYASPESPYSHNSDLAIGRTEALKQYIKRLYNFNDNLIYTDYQPEDWDGLRKYVEHSDRLSDKEGILALIDRTDLDPDVRESRIKKAYPDDYRFLLENCYPALRHTDYRVAYTIRSFTDMDELKQVFATQPQKLSLNEIYLIAQTYEPGTDEFSDIFETAVRLYPDDEIANLNAANASLSHNNLTAAERYLEKAGESPEAKYARGVLKYKKDDIAGARAEFAAAAAMGLNRAADALHLLD